MLLPYLCRAQCDNREDRLLMECIMIGLTLLSLFLYPKPSHQPMRRSISVRNDHATPTSNFPIIYSKLNAFQMIALGKVR